MREHADAGAAEYVSVRSGGRQHHGAKSNDMDKEVEGIQSSEVKKDGVKSISFLYPIEVIQIGSSCFETCP
jgi:hypothetical protein